MTVGLTIGTIREALAAQIRNNIAADCTVDAYPTGTQTTSPRITIELQRNPIDFWMTFGRSGLATLRLDLIVEPSASDISHAAQRLDQFLSVGTGNTWSVVDAVMQDRTLGLGAGIDVVVEDVNVDPEIVAHFLVTVTVSKQGASA